MSETFGEALRLAVDRSGKNQNEIATEAEIEQASLSRYLRGSEPTASNLRRLCAVLPELRSWLDIEKAAS